LYIIIIIIIMLLFGHFYSAKIERCSKCALYILYSCTPAIIILRYYCCLGL